MTERRRGRRLGVKNNKNKFTRKNYKIEALEPRLC